MIVVGISEGLGNKMFHYAFAKSLEAKGLDVYCDVDSYTPHPNLKHETIRLTDAFPDIEMKTAPKGSFRFAYSKSPDRRVKLFYDVMRRAVNMICPSTYVLEADYGYQPDMEKRCGTHSFCIGHWQSEKYFAGIRDELLRQFAFLPFDEPENIGLAGRMAAENSVAVHVRKGPDYQFSPHLCDMNYYRRAIDHIRANVENPRFYIFTDNSGWVRRNFGDVDYTLVDWNPSAGERSFRDMQLMTCAKHNIIANSSYSWWGAWLNRNPDKIVTAPKIFFSPKDYFYRRSDVVCADWTAL